MNKKGEAVNFNMVYFDTNIFMDVACGEIPGKDWQTMIMLSDERGIRRFFSVVNLIERGSNLEPMGKKRFIDYKKTFRVINECCGTNILPDPESVLASYFDGRQLEEQTDLLVYVDLILKARDYTSLAKTGQVIAGQRHTIKGDFMARFRKSYEDNYCREITQVISAINPGYTFTSGDRPEVKDKKKRAKLDKLFYSDDFIEIMLGAILERCGFPQPEEIGSDILKKLDSLDGYISLYRYILHQIVFSGRKAERKKNDFNDLEFLIYLGQGGIFVTEEKQFKAALVSSSQKDQVKNFSEFLTFLQQGG